MSVHTLTHSAINIMKSWAIELEDKSGGKKFVIKLPDRTYYLMAQVCHARLGYARLCYALSLSGRCFLVKTYIHT